MKHLNKKNTPKTEMVKRRYWTAAGTAVLCLCCATPAMAAGTDPLDIVNNLSDFIFSIIKAISRLHIKEEAAPPPQPAPSAVERLLSEFRGLLKENKA